MSTFGERYRDSLFSDAAAIFGWCQMRDLVLMAIRANASSHFDWKFSHIESLGSTHWRKWSERELLSLKILHDLRLGAVRCDIYWQWIGNFSLLFLLSLARQCHKIGVAFLQLRSQIDRTYFVINHQQLNDEEKLLSWREEKKRREKFRSIVKVDRSKSNYQRGFHHF